MDHRLQTTGQQRAGSRELGIINRGFTQTDTERNPFKILPQRRRGRREFNFCLSGDDDKQKQISLEAPRICPIVVSRLGKRDFLSVLCVSAVKCPNPYLR